MENQKKPLILEIEDAKAELVNCVNHILKHHGLNCYLIEPLVADLYSQIQAGAQNELAQARAQMEAAKVASSNEE